MLVIFLIQFLFIRPDFSSLLCHSLSPSLHLPNSIFLFKFKCYSNNTWHFQVCTTRANYQHCVGLLWKSCDWEKYEKSRFVKLYIQHLLLVTVTSLALLISSYPLSKSSCMINQLNLTSISQHFTSFHSWFFFHFIEFRWYGINSLFIPVLTKYVVCILGIGTINIRKRISRFIIQSCFNMPCDWSFFPLEIQH